MLSGWFDADGSVQGSTVKGVSVRLSSSSKSNLEVAQRMLSRFGIISKIYFRRPEMKKLLPNGHGGEDFYTTKEQYELIITKENLGIFRDKVGFLSAYKQDYLEMLLNSYTRTLNKETFTSKIITIESLGVQSVFDCTVEEVHEFCANGIRVHNCGEQTMPFRNLLQPV